MKKIWIIASNEFLENFRSRGYLLATFGAPLLTLCFIIIFGSQKGVLSSKQQVIRLGLVDATNTIIDPKLFKKDNKLSSNVSHGSGLFQWMDELPREWKMIDNRILAQKEVMEDQVDAVLIIERKVEPEETFEFSLLIKETKTFLLPFMKINKNWLMQRWLNDSLRPSQHSAFRNFTLPGVEKINSQGEVEKTDFKQASLNENEKSSWVHIGVFLVAIMLLSGYLSTGLTDEREQKTLEFLFTLVTPFELLTGKLIGVLMSGLVQVITWGITFVFPALFFVWSLKNAFYNWVQPFFFFFFGYLFYGGVLLSLSSSSSTGRESRQIAATWLFFNSIPLAFYPYIIANSDDWFTRVLSFFPVSAPITMMVRLGIEQTTAWEILLSLAILITSTLLVLRLSAGRVLKNMMRKV